MKGRASFLPALVLLIAASATVGCAGGGSPDEWDPEAWEYALSESTDLREGEWAVEWSNNGRYPTVTDIACDSQGNVIVTDTYYREPAGMAWRGPDGVYIDKSLGQTSIRKFDSTGNLRWSRTWSGLMSGDLWFEFREVEVDDEGNIYAAGYTSGTVDVDPDEGVTEVTSNGKNDAILCKFSRDGSLVWARNWGGDDHDGATGLSVDGAGDVYVAGHFYNSVDFDPGEGASRSATSGIHNYFLSRFDRDGEFAWVRTWSGGEIDRSRDFSSIMVASDESGNVCVVSPNAGTARRTTYTQLVGGMSRRQSATQYRDQSSLRYFSRDGETVWECLWDVRCSGVAMDAEGCVYASGSFSGLVDVNPGRREEELFSTGIASGEHADAILCKLDSDGDFVWYKRWGGDGEDVTMGVTIGETGRMCVFGTFQGAVDFDPGSVEAVRECRPVAGYESPQPNCYISMFRSDGRWLNARVWPKVCADACATIDPRGFVYNTLTPLGTLTKSVPQGPGL